MKSIMQNYFYLIIGMAIGGMITLLLPNVNAQTSYCDSEAYIYLINNNLEGLFACINFPDQQQDMRLSQIETKVEDIEREMNNTRIDNK